METIIGSANGTTFLEISKANFRPIQVLVPPESILVAFVAQVDPLHRRVVSNLKESRTLAALRDTLLPKLISGEVRVPEAERMIGHAV
jgi:type I restriction enzyme S subunit